MEYEYYSDVEAIGETEMALFCEIDGEQYWIPKSVIGDDSEVTERGDVGTLSVKAWFAEKKLG